MNEINKVFTEAEILENAIAYVREIFIHDFSGHDFSHTMRVYRMATRLAEEEGADLFIVRLAALLHDIDDAKLSPETCTDKGRAISFMVRQSLDDSLQKKIITIVDEISFSGGNKKPPTTIEGMCVQDADRLDALGAVGIARAFAYGGSRGRQLYDPEIPPRDNMTESEYRKSNSTTVNHFYEKLFKLKDLMNTSTAKRIATQREKLMKQYLRAFLAEWNGAD
ncbi:MAG: HD domain-containing protein [Bacillota bacterium]|nr:HD domain-containing protein [Bacillota bacterium]